MPEPQHLATGWVGFDDAAALSHLVNLLNDADMQAVGSYRGSALIVQGMLVPVKLARLPHRKRTCEDDVGLCGLEKRAKK